MNVALLVVDEVGFEQLGRTEATLLFRLVSYRYGRGSILITTNSVDPAPRRANGGRQSLAGTSIVVGAPRHEPDSASQSATSNARRPNAPLRGARSALPAGSLAPRFSSREKNKGAPPPWPPGRRTASVSHDANP
jgi:hypothetical protein